jgi:hypothetical protein
MKVKVQCVVCLLIMNGDEDLVVPKHGDPMYPGSQCPGAGAKGRPVTPP